MIMTMKDMIPKEVQVMNAWMAVKQAIETHERINNAMTEVAMNNRVQEYIELVRDELEIDYAQKKWINPQDNEEAFNIRAYQRVCDMSR